jgi:hypothetical protein
VSAPARVGAIAPEPIIVPAGGTVSHPEMSIVMLLSSAMRCWLVALRMLTVAVQGQDAQKTSFFQALNIPTKIARGTIEIMTEVRLLETGDRVGPSESALLNMLGISPFAYGIELLQVRPWSWCLSQCPLACAVPSACRLHVYSRVCLHVCVPSRSTREARALEPRSSTSPRLT